jgi:putative membrane protein
VSGWALDPLPALSLAAVAVAYGAGARRAAGWPAARTASFLAGMALLFAALQSGLHADGERSLAAHMVQHLVLTMVVPPLLVLGRPLALLVRGGPRAARRPAAGLLRSRAARALARPGVALAIFAAVLVATHVPAFYDAALRTPALHDLEHVLYLGASLVFWQVVLAPEPQPRAVSPLLRILLLLAAMVPMAAVGVALLVPDAAVYATYAHALGADALADQRRGGSIMWLWGTLLLAVAVLTAGWWGVEREERRAAALEAALEGRRR